MNKKWKILIFTIIFIIIAVFLGLFIHNYIKTHREDDTRKREEVIDADEIRDRLGISLNISATKSEAGYFIEDKDIARIEYTARNMRLVLKSSSDGNKNLANLVHDWDFPIRMVSICDDGSDIEVTAAVAMDNNKIMKAEWYDNDLYYSMNTFDLTTREDFLQEVNKIIIECHEEFE